MNVGFGAGQGLEDEQASSYVAFGDDLYRKGSFIGAIMFYQTALDMPELVGQSRAYCQQQLENALNQVDIADTNYHIEIQSDQLTGLSGEARATCLYDLARLHCKVRNYAAAIDHLTSALAMPELTGQDSINCEALLIRAQAQQLREPNIN